MWCGWDDVGLLLDFTLCWDHEIHIHEFLVSCLQEFKELDCLVMLIELYVGSWVWWTYEWWIYDIITSNGVEMVNDFVMTIGSSDLRIIKKGRGIELIMNVPWLIKNLSFLMLLDSIGLLLLS